MFLADGSKHFLRLDLNQDVVLVLVALLMHQVHECTVKLETYLVVLYGYI
jgi:hypothetical protein